MLFSVLVPTSTHARNLILQRQNEAKLVLASRCLSRSPTLRYGRLIARQLGSPNAWQSKMQPSRRTQRCTKPGWVRESHVRTACETYTDLVHIPLVNDNLLPARQETDTILKDAHIPDNMASLIKVSQTFDPWPSIAQCQRDNPTVYFQTVLTLRGVLEEPIHMLMLLPTALPAVPDIELYWGQSTTFTVSSVSLPSRVLVEAGTCKTQLHQTISSPHIICHCFTV